ncbi:DoxX family protein [Bacillus suaedaesalsae]|uniref:DoxX family protein n=1 Tax=Bacillus suaedaesalsae TaxID=2810349 RepID=A0ABS2DK45_9BACI|nr:DoxX family protein [Bacillus suaedaesalsae]MBM6617848.1 DoxX family protein [Bacillus suaedaesalsae]
MMKWLREIKYAAGLLLVLRVYLGWTWMSAGWHKITADQPFDATGYLKGAIGNPVVDKATGDMLYPTYMAFLENFALPNAGLINIMIPYGEFLVGLGLIVGVLTTAAAFFGLLMNFMFMFAGTISTNPWMTLLGIIILVAGMNAARFGGDYYVAPYLKKMIAKHNKSKNKKIDI